MTLVTLLLAQWFFFAHYCFYSTNTPFFFKDFPVAQTVKSACNAADQGSIPELGRSSGSCKHLDETNTNILLFHHQRICQQVKRKINLLVLIIVQASQTSQGSLFPGDCRLSSEMSISLSLLECKSYDLRVFFFYLVHWYASGDY